MKKIKLEINRNTGLIRFIVVLIMMISLEAACIYRIISGDAISEGIGITILINLTLIPLGCLFLYGLYKMLNLKGSFEVYVQNLNNDLDIEKIKNNFCIKYIDENKVVYVGKEFEKHFNCYTLFNEIKY